MIAIHNLETGEVEIRKATAKEITERQAAEKANQDVETNKEAVRQALLDRLGITADEAGLLLG
jgi:hypothetical protein